MGSYLLSGLVGGGHHHSVADGESDKEVNDVRQVGGDLAERLAVETHKLHLAGAVVHFIQELWVWCDVFLLHD